VLKNIKITDKPDVFEGLKKFHISKVILNVDKNTILLEGSENQSGETKIFCIEPEPSKKGQCVFRHGSKNDKEGRGYLDVDKLIVGIPFNDILKHLRLGQLLGYFIVSDMITE